MKYFTKQLAATSLVAALTAMAGGSTAFADVNTRYGELQAVIDAINDPDPLMRLAQLEEILKKGDATEVQLAIRTAFQVDDPNVRSLAVRAHFASFRTFIVTAELPEDVQSALDGNDEEKKEYWNNNDFYRYLRNYGYQFAFSSKYPSSDALEFELISLNRKEDEREDKRFGGTGNIRGGLITLAAGIRQINVSSPLRCSFEFTDYDAFTMKGNGACDMKGAFQFPVRLHLFDNDKPSNGN